MQENPMDATARYFDGVRPVAQDVLLRRISVGLEIRLDPSRSPVVWPYAEARIDGMTPEARLHRVKDGLDTGERVVLAGEDFTRLFGSMLGAFGKGRAGEASRSRILFWSGTAIASLAFLYFVGLSAFARYAAPLVPWHWEAALGKSIEPEVLGIFSRGKPAEVCGGPTSAGKAALEIMVAKLAAGARLPGPLRVDVLDVGQTNAFALPGARIFLFRPVIEKAGDPDEVAGVLAHEIGHVIHRDSMRALIHDGALSLVIAAVLGDFTGGSTVAMLGNMMLGSAYSRENESEADRVSVDLMRKAGADAGAINRFFQRLGKDEKNGRSILDVFRSHPITAERIEEVGKLAAGSAAKAPLLDARQWADLKGICAEPRAAGKI
jgi:beta-barrel assembly-enhancing protease